MVGVGWHRDDDDDTPLVTANTYASLLPLSRGRKHPRACVRLKDLCVCRSFEAILPRPSPSSPKYTPLKKPPSPACQFPASKGRQRTSPAQRTTPARPNRKYVLRSFDDDDYAAKKGKSVLADNAKPSRAEFQGRRRMRKRRKKYHIVNRLPLFLLRLDFQIPANACDNL